MLTKDIIDNTIKDILEDKIPASLIQQREVAGQKLSYISGSFVIDILNRAFDYLWDWKIDHYWIQPSVSKKYKDKISGKVTEIEQPPVAHVIGTLTVYFKNEDGNLISISKSAPGSKVLIGGASEQESIFKSAHTDALKKAASLLGIGAQLYRNPKENNYFLEKKLAIAWSDQAIMEHQTDFEYIDKCKDVYNFTDNIFNDMVRRWSEGKIIQIKDLMPQELEDFVKYLKEQEAQSNK